MYAILIPLVISAVLALGIPALTELSTKLVAPPWVKSVVAAGLSGATGTLVTVVYDPGQPVVVYLSAIGVAWLVSMRAYFVGLDYPGKIIAPESGLGPRNPGSQV